MNERKTIGDMKHGLTGARAALSLLPRAGINYGCRGLDYGQAKYARGNYHGPAPAKLGPNASALRVLGYLDAALRHLTEVTDAANRALGTGGDIAAALCLTDDEASGNFPASGLPHLAHALASLLLGVTCGVDDGLMPRDPGQPWAVQIEAGLPQKDDPAAERARVAALRDDPFGVLQKLAAGVERIASEARVERYAYTPAPLCGSDRCKASVYCGGHQCGAEDIRTEMLARARASEPGVYDVSVRPLSVAETRRLERESARKRDAGLIEGEAVS